MDDETRRTGRRLPRLPLPAKLLISYLVVLAVAAGPTFVYVRSELQADLLEMADARLAEGTRRAAAGLMPYSDRELVTRTRQISSVLPQRVTLVAKNGDVLFDSDANVTEGHGSRPEIAAARQQRPLADVSRARRTSATTGSDSIYAATLLVEGGPVLRLADHVDDVTGVAKDLTIFARNVSAAAISIAVLMSLLAAVLFVRPLQRLVKVARELAVGDLSIRSEIDTNDEVGDTARALDQMALDLRRRLANAGSGDAVLAQLVDALSVPCVVIESSGEPLTLNGAARRALRMEGTSSRRRVQQVAQSGRFRRAVLEAEADGDPEPCVIVIDDDVRFEGYVHVLKRPGAAPLTVLLGHEEPNEDPSHLPASDEPLVPRSFVDLIADARSRTAATLAEQMVAIDIDDEPAVQVAEVGGRLLHALVILIEGCAKATDDDVMSMDVHVEETRVRVIIDVEMDKGIGEMAGQLVMPLGGAVSVDEGESRLWLPRA